MSDNAKPLQHLGLILDGNRRWARAHNLPTLQGHKKGYENLKVIVKEAINSGIPFVSAYIFSTENWKRSQEEVSYLMDLALFVAKNEVKELHKENIRVVFLGSKEKLSNKLIQAIDKAEQLTQDNKKGTLALCFNYGGLQEIADAATKALSTGRSALTPEDIEQHLYAPDIPPVDLVIRTSGEQRISGFMLWRAAYAEMLFVQKNWPDFSVDDLKSAVDYYSSRERRFGL